MPPPLRDQLCFTLYATSMAVSRLYKPMLDRMGITYPQYLVLNVLGEEAASEDGLTVGAIADRLYLESSTVTPPIKRLAQAGLVTRRRGETDERQVRVHLTEAGRVILDQSNCLAEALLKRSGMTMEEIKPLNGVLQSLRGVLSEE
jgi:DNA-binding MarR family transcriptional regulator